MFRRGRADETNFSPTKPFSASRADIPKRGLTINLPTKRRANGVNSIDNTDYQAAIPPAVPPNQVGLLQQGDIPPGFQGGSRGIIPISSK